MRVHTDAFWQAVESFSDNVAGRDWAEVSRHLLDLPEVRAETARLRHAAAWRRALAARHLGLLHATAARDDLRRVMARGPKLVTLTAALALARLHDLEALDWLLEHPYLTASFGRYQLIALIQRFGPDARASVREAVEGWEVASPIHVAAIEALGAWRDTGATKVLRRILSGGTLEARVAAARALGRIGGFLANDALVAALDDYSWQVRAQAARSLGRGGAPEAVARLAARLGDSAWWVRRNAAYALAEAGETGHVALETVVASSSDPFAVEMAEEVLQMLEWERERREDFTVSHDLAAAIASSWFGFALIAISVVLFMVQGVLALLAFIEAVRQRRLQLLVDRLSLFEGDLAPPISFCCPRTTSSSRSPIACVRCCRATPASRSSW